MSVGTLNRLAFTVSETGYGVAQAAPTKSWPFKGDRPAMKLKAVDDSDTLTGGMLLGLSSGVGNIQMTAKFTFDFRWDTLAYFLQFALGSVATTGAADPYTHTFTNIAGDVPSFTLYWQDANTTATKLEQFPGCKVEQLVISGKGGDKWTIEVTIVGQGVHSEVVAAMPALNIDPPEPFSMTSEWNVGGTITWATGVIAAGTSYLQKLLDASVTFKNVFDTKNAFVAGQTYLGSCQRTQLEVTGKATHRWDENALAAGTILNLVETQTPDTLTLAVVNATHSATFNFAKVYLDDGSVKGDKTTLTKPFTWKAFYDAVAGHDLQAIVLNEIASYT